MHDQNDDGESAAGGRLQHLLQITDARNVVRGEGGVTHHAMWANRGSGCRWWW